MHSERLTMDVWHRSLELPCTARSVYRAREFVGTVLVERGRAELILDARAIASELSTNAIVHARCDFTLGLLAHAGHVVVSVFDGSDLLPVRRTPSASATGGRGLLLIEAFSGAWGVQQHADGGKTVWARLRAVDGQAVARHG